MEANQVLRHDVLFGNRKIEGLLGEMCKNINLGKELHHRVILIGFLLSS